MRTESSGRPLDRGAAAASGQPAVSTRVAVVLASWFGCGYSPFAPGTAGSAAAVAIGVALEQVPGWSPWHFALLSAVLLAPAVWAANRTAASLGRKDPSLVVVDEVIGQWVTISGAPALNWKSWLAAFLLFRALDIWKPWPANRLESLPGGAGILADDVMAGVYGALVLYAAGCFNLY